MASYKSQYAPPRRVEDVTPTTRLPKRSITPTTSTSQLPTSSGYSKLQKRRPSRDEPAPSARSLPTPTDRTREISTRQTSTIATSSSIQRPGFTSYRSASSSSRLPKLDVHVNINTRTPSLVSGSSASTIESPRSNVLRRKQPSVGITGSRHALMTRDEPMSSQEDTRSAEGTSGKFKDPFTESVFGISLPPSSNVLARSDPVFESLQHGLYDNIDPLDIYPVPTPQYALSATPSTRNADSPGAFSVSSAATSMTSYSPATALSKPSYRVRQVSPLESRPPVRRQRAPEEPDSRTAHVLSTVRESSTSSSSASTVVADMGKADLAKKRMPAVPQSHPLSGESSIKQARPRVQPVPELAHLADPSPVSLHARRPSRPSRDGTPELHGLRDPSPIIQSNMSNFPGHHRRTSSSDSKFGSLSVSRSRAAIPVKASSRNPSPIPVSSIPSTPSGLKRGTTPDDMRERDERRSSTMPGPATTVSTGKRFGLFSRRTKTDPAPQPSKVNSKLVRKGPAAGTGHEGYGRHASRGKSSSSIGASIGRSASAGTTSESLTQTPSTRKSSMTSTTSGEMDEFFLNRLTPVILRGAGSSSELSRSPEPMNSSSSLDISTRALPMGNTCSVTAEPTNNRPRPKLLPSAMPNTMRNASPAHKPSRRPSESDDDTKRSFLPTLSSKRTSRIARPTEGVSNAPRSRSISKTRKDSASDEGSWLRSSKKAKAEKEKERPKASKWNFFSRAHGAPRVETPAAQELNTASPGPGSRSLAHYALVDAQSSLDMKDLEELMKEAAGNTDTESVFSDNDSMRKERMQSILLPPKPIMPAFSAPSRPASPKVVLRSDQSPQRYPAPTVNTDVQPAPESSPRHSQTGTIFDLSPPSSPVTRQHDHQDDVTAKHTPAPVTHEQASHAGRPEGVTSSGSVTPCSAPRPSRLPQIGRIPKVVSSRGKPRGPSSRSFSRPFVTEQPRPVALPRTSFDSIGPVVATAGPVEPFPVLQGLSALCSGSAIATISPFDESRQSEFFKFPPRKDSEVSYSSSSGVWSFAPVAGTAVVPPPEAPFSDDELWNEYDDLLDDVVSPGGTIRKAGPARRQPSSLEPPVLHEKSSCVSFLSGTSEQERPVSSVHLRRSRLLAALYAHQSPTSSMALSDVINDYSDRKLSVVDSTTGRLSMPLSPSLSTVSAQRRSARTSLPASLQSTDRQSKAVIASRSETDRTVTTTATRYRDTRLMDIAEAQAFGHASMADLRFAALMTSKWLSFGRVLFSPVHYQLKDVNEDRVLVIDGTGKDWSFYCALTYSDAAVYDLGPAPSSPPSKDRKSALPNHRHIRHSSLTHALPYPQNFFACVVLRFPSAQPSTTHNFLLSEAKRVLRPGGYLEFSVLDLDLVNMGNRARKAVRQLKMDIHRVDDTISLRNISDEIIAGLGRKRFVECKSCVVGVPVAGSLPTPNDVNHPMRKNSTASSRMRADNNLQPSALPKSEPSFSDLLNAPTPSETTDMGIADKVARVGRWWYSRCYESIILPDNDGPDAALSSDILKNSIWRDDNLIRECEELGTSFRMLIGYAQKPEVSLRRHVSV
jgi:SAM-dependent methyltransferase